GGDPQRRRTSVPGDRGQGSEAGEPGVERRGVGRGAEASGQSLVGKLYPAEMLAKVEKIAAGAG
ncbi:MAG TPA: hypothetical protein VI197_08145, partial [Polyangiaceae bacterium]